MERRSFMAELYEAFVYLWYDALNRMFYLGKHKGSIDDNYTHSSTVWESFTKDNIPEGATRRILAYGTDEEMCDLETKLLKNRKERRWDRYYNVKWHTKAIGNLNDVLSEADVKLWKERISLAHKGKSKPTTSAGLKKFHESITDEQRKKLYGKLLETNPNWKGGIALPENMDQYRKDTLKRYKEFGIKLLNEGYSYYEIKSKYPAVANKLPYFSLPQEEKDRRNKYERDRYENKAECYCRKDTCDYCVKAGYVLTVKERKRRRAEQDAKKYEMQKNDPIWVENKRKKDRERRIKRAAEKQANSSTLDKFLD